MMTRDEILDAFRRKMLPRYGVFTDYAMEHVSASLIHNTHLFIDVWNIRVSGTVERKRVSATLTVLDTRTNRTFAARYLLIQTSKKYKATITEKK